MRISEEKIQEIRDAIDLIEVVSQYVTLKKRGKSFMGLCPFHQEKTASFSVDPVRGFYHCFGCGEGGNVFTFVMQMERVGFPEAVRSLAQKANIHIPKYDDQADQVKETEILYRVNQFAAEFYHHCLLSTEAGQKTQDYLARRNFQSDIIKLFLLGYAPDSWDGLLTQARKKGFSERDLLKAGLIVARKNSSGYYDRFRTRLMFPIFNASGRVVGFGGRNLKKEGGPKYMNSPETPVYQKGRLLYGLYQSKSGIRQEDKVLLVEGYTDVMQLYHHGFDYAVATSGTALTEEQAKLLLRYTKNIILVFDGDSAGFSAAVRGLDILVGAGFAVRIVPLPKGSDPDSLLRKKGKGVLEKLLHQSNTFVDFQLEKVREKIQSNLPQEKAKAAHTLLMTISRIRDPLEQSLMVKDISEKLGIDETLLIRQLRQSKHDPAVDVSLKARPVSSGVQTAEEGILFLLLSGNISWSQRIFHCIESDHFYFPQNQLLFSAIHEQCLKKGKIDVPALMDKYVENASIEKLLSKLSAMELGKDVDLDLYGRDCIKTIQQKKIKDEMQQLKEKIRSMQKKGGNVDDLSRRWVELQKALNTIEINIAKTWKKNVDI